MATTQFGGENNKKFMKSRFKETLSNIQHLNMNEQGIELERIFREWTGDNELVDDVLVVGVEF